MPLPSEYCSELPVKTFSVHNCKTNRFDRMKSRTNAHTWNPWKRFLRSAASSFCPIEAQTSVYTTSAPATACRHTTAKPQVVANSRSGLCSTDPLQVQTLGFWSFWHRKSGFQKCPVKKTHSLEVDILEMPSKIYNPLGL